MVWKSIAYIEIPEHIRYMCERPEAYQPLYHYLPDGRFIFIICGRGTCAYHIRVDAFGIPTRDACYICDDGKVNILHGDASIE